MNDDPNEPQWVSWVIIAFFLVVLVIMALYACRKLWVQ